MNSDERMREILREHCAEAGEEDGRNPCDEEKGGRNGGAEYRKSQQLCRQVAEALDWVLSGDSPDDLLRSLRVATVEPAPNTSRLLVTVVSDLPPDVAPPQSILELLRQHSGRLRREVAASIHRRKTPMLIFRVIGGAGGTSVFPG